MYNWKDTRNYRRFRDENGNVIANIIYVDGEEVAVSDEVYEAYASMERRERYLTDEAYLPMTTLLSSIPKRSTARWSRAWAARSLKSPQRHPIISTPSIWNPDTTTVTIQLC